jgi:DNA-binding GntR family transcriptional regulator
MQINRSSTVIPLARRNLRDQAVAVLRQQLLEGRLAGRINESELSAELGISRTPLREALLGLEKEGLVATSPGRGFSVVPLSAQEVAEVYPILWTLECLALRLRGFPAARELSELLEINRRLEASLHEPSIALELDTEWHTALLKDCPNTRLQESIRHLKQSAYRYEYAYMREANRVVTSATQHRQIIAALRKKDMDRAVAILEENWRITLEVTESWLAQKVQRMNAAALPRTLK